MYDTEVAMSKVNNYKIVRVRIDVIPIVTVSVSSYLVEVPACEHSLPIMPHPYLLQRANISRFNLETNILRVDLRYQ